MKLLNLAHEQAALGFTHKIILTHEDLTNASAGAAQTIEFMAVAIGDIVLEAAFRLVTPFKDASDNDFNSTVIEIGDGGDTDRYVTAELNENGTEILAKGWADRPMPYAYVAADTIDAKFSSMSGKALEDIDVGEVHVFLKVVKLASL